MKRRTFSAGLLALWCARAALADALPETEATAADVSEPATLLEQGMATWYGGRRWQGRRTASGERFDGHAFTAAHPRLPLGSWVRVVNLRNGREVQVRINDRGPSKRGFVIDLSETAAQALGFRRQGRAKVALHRSTAPHASRKSDSSF